MIAERPDDPMSAANQNAGEPNHGERPPYPSDRTVIDQLYEHVARTPAALALVVPEGDGATDRGRLEISYAEMWAMTGQAAEALVAARARASSDWVILVLPQGLQQVVAVWATLRSGCGYVPIDADTQAARLRVLFGETQPCLAIGEAGGATPLAEVGAESGVAVGTFPHGARGGLVVASFVAGLPNEEALLPAQLPSPTPADLALLLFSSGSTGTPKGIMYDHTWLMGGSYFVGRDLELTPRSRTV
jgi:acyl-coenzyme A synthetase/AMP-(fatty) acid ligase